MLLSLPHAFGGIDKGKMMQPPMVETQRIPLAPEELETLGRLGLAAEQAKNACAEYVNELGVKYSLHATHKDFHIAFDISAGCAIIKEPQRVLVARTTKTQ